MKTPSTRQKILDAAQRVIEKDGSTGLTTKEIAREAGCAEGTLFKHFKSKEDLRLAVVLENAPEFREKLAQPKAGQRTVVKNLEHVAMTSIAFFEKLSPLSASLFADAELLRQHRGVMLKQKRGPQDVFALIETYISAEQQLNRINRRVKPASAAALLLGPCFHRVFIRHAMGKGIPGDSSDREFVAFVVATLVGGLSPTAVDDSDWRKQK
jgi:AcrR family transcriptional regulator